MSSQNPPSTGRRLSPIIARASIESENCPNGVALAPPPTAERHHHHIRLKPLSRAPKLGAESSKGKTNDRTGQEERPSAGTSGNSTEIPFHKTVIGTLDVEGVISVDNSRGKRGESSAQAINGQSQVPQGTNAPGIVRLDLGHADFRPGLPKSPPSRTATNTPIDYFVPRRPTHQVTNVSNKTSRGGRERLWAHHRAWLHHTGTNPWKSEEDAEAVQKRKHWAESDEKQREYWRIIEKLASPEHKDRKVRFDYFYRGMRGQGPQDREAGRAAVVEFFEDGKAETKEFEDSGALRDYFNAQEATKKAPHESGDSLSNVQHASVEPSPTLNPAIPSKPLRRIFILEDLPLNHLEILGSRLCVHPDVFASHYSCDQGWAFTHSLGCLPSGSHDKRRFKLRYSTLMPKTYVQMNRKKPCPPWLVKGGPEDWFNPKFNVVRGLETPFDNGDWDYRGKHAELEGQVSYWARTGDGGGWDGKPRFISKGTSHRSNSSPRIACLRFTKPYMCLLLLTIVFSITSCRPSFPRA
jgi:hypothetical protein